MNESLIAPTFTLFRFNEGFSFVCLFLDGGYLVYNVMLVSAIQQHASAIWTHTSPPF